METNHLNVLQNAEIGLGTVTDVQSAKRWLAGTFLYVRLNQNPGHYNLDGDTRGNGLDERIESICARDIQLLQESDLITTGGSLKSTEFGDAMARYYIKFETMKIVISLQQRAKMSEIVSFNARASFYHSYR